MAERQAAFKAVMLNMVQLLRARASSLVEGSTARVSTISADHILAVLDVSLKHAALTPEQLCRVRDEVLHECRRVLFPVLDVVNAVVTYERGLPASDAQRIVDVLWRFWSGAQPVDPSVLDMCRCTGFQNNRIEIAQTSLLPFLRAYAHAVIGAYLTLRRGAGSDLDMAVLAGVMYRSSAVVQDRLHRLCEGNLSQIEEEFAEGLRSCASRPRWTAMWAAYFSRRDVLSFADVRMRDALASGDLTLTPEYLCAVMTDRLFQDADDASEEGCVWRLVEFEGVVCKCVREWLTDATFPRLLVRQDRNGASFAFMSSRKRVCLRPS